MQRSNWGLDAEARAFARDGDLLLSAAVMDRDDRRMAVPVQDWPVGDAGAVPAAQDAAASSKKTCTVWNSAPRLRSIHMPCVPSPRITSRLDAAAVSNGNSALAM